MHIKRGTLSLKLFKKIGLIFVLVNIVAICCLFQVFGSQQENYFECYTNDCNPSVLLPIIESTQEPTGEQNIFFLETKAHESGISILNPRQACAIESAAKVNPDMHIFLYIKDSNTYRMDGLWNIIRLLNNVHIKKMDAFQFTKGTPTEKLIREGLATKPEWLVSHTSDVLRYTTLFKYAGVYMDLDMISIRPLNGLGLNFACQEVHASHDLVVGSAIVAFGNNTIGRQMAKLVVEDVAANFTGKEWGANGLATLTRSIAKTCKTNKVAEATVERCEGFQVLHPDAFFAIPFYEHNTFFDESKFVEGMKKLNPAYGAHLWNYLSAHLKPKKEVKNVFNTLAKSVCPKTFEIVTNNM